MSGGSRTPRGRSAPTPSSSSARSGTSPAKLDVGMRSKAKMVNYGIVYGLSAYGLADRLQIPQEEAQEFIDRYLERFPAVAQFMRDAVEQAQEHGYVSTLFGRRRHHQSGDGALPRRARLGRHADAHHPADPRRAAVRGARGGGRAGGGDRQRRDGRRSRPRPAAGGRGRHRAELARGEVVTRTIVRARRREPAARRAAAPPTP